MFHRRQRTEGLEAKLKKLDTLESDNEELQILNEDLLHELEKRDVAVKEAVNLICDLEARIEEMEHRVAGPQHTTSASDLESRNCNSSSEPFYPPVDDTRPITPTSRSTPRLGDLKPPKLAASAILVDTSIPAAARSPGRTPSFLKDNKKSTRALRGLYSVDDNSTQGNPSLFSLARPSSRFSADDQQRDVDPDSYTLNSPRLSMLSESSFLSVYGKPRESDVISARKKEGNSLEESSSEDERTAQDLRQQARVHKWINDRSTQASPRRRFVKDKTAGQFSSIDELVDEIPIETQTFRPRRARQMPSRSSSRQKRDESTNYPPRPSLGGALFGHEVLPPTPDTMSTSHREANSSTPSIITEKSLLDGTPSAAQTYKVLVPDARPQTAGGNGNVSGPAPTIAPGNDASLTEREGEFESTQVAESHAGRVGYSQVPQLSTFMGGPLKAKRHVDLPKRPLLTNYATDMMFNGEDYDLVQPSRTVSYPAPEAGKRRRSVQFAPAGHEASDITTKAPTSLSPGSRTNEVPLMITPTRERPGALYTDSPLEGRVHASPIEPDKQSSSQRLKNLFLGKFNSPATKADANLAESPPSQSQTTSPPTHGHRRPSSVHIQNTWKPLPDPTTVSRTARPGSARDSQNPNKNQFGSTRRYSGVPDASIIPRDQDVDLPDPEQDKVYAERARGSDLPYGKSDSGVVHRRMESELRQSTKSTGEDAGGRKWGIGIPRSASWKMKEGLSGLMSRQK